MSPLFSPLLRALDQLGDRVFLGVLLRSVAWSALCFMLLYAATLWGVQRLLHLYGLLAWLADLLSTVGAALLALWLFLPVAAVIATLYIERIALAVERRYYPWLPPPRGAPIGEQIADGIGLGLKILLLSLLALVLAVALQGIGLVLGWAIAAYGIGRGLFVAVAMRRMPRPAAVALYRHSAYGSAGTGRHDGPRRLRSGAQPADSGHRHGSHGARAGPRADRSQAASLVPQAYRCG